MKPVKKVIPEPVTAKAPNQTENSKAEPCAEDALICPCFPHINIDDHITSGNVPKK